MRSNSLLDVLNQGHQEENDKAVLEEILDPGESDDWELSGDGFTFKKMLSKIMDDVQIDSFREFDEEMNQAKQDHTKGLYFPLEKEENQKELRADSRKIMDAAKPRTLIATDHNINEPRKSKFNKGITLPAGINEKDLETSQQPILHNSQFDTNNRGLSIGFSPTLTREIDFPNEALPG